MDYSAGVSVCVCVCIPVLSSFAAHQPTHSHKLTQRKGEAPASPSHRILSVILLSCLTTLSAQAPSTRRRHHTSPSLPSALIPSSLCSKDEEGARSWRDTTMKRGKGENKTECEKNVSFLLLLSVWLPRLSSHRREGCCEKEWGVTAHLCF